MKKVKLQNPKLSYQTFNKAIKLINIFGKTQYMKIIKKDNNKTLGKYVCSELENMGPTFIKLGQFISTRSDVFGKDFTSEFSSLQDRVPSVEFKNLNLTSNILNLFETIEEKPLASASIGQVHQAKLKNGKDVVIKIKRPDIDKLIENDFGMLIKSIDFIKLFWNDRKIQEIEILLIEYYSMLKEEINFDKEKLSMSKFYNSFKNTQWVKVPSVYLDESNNDVIIMEYVKSFKITDMKKLKELNFNREKISEKIIESYVSQIIDYGFVHIDPHPGNIGMTETGKIVFYDYGMVLELDNNFKNNFKKLLVAVAEKDIDEICKILEELEIVIVEKDKYPLFKKFISSFLSYINTLDLEEFKVSYINKVDSTEMPFLLSSKFLSLLRGLSLLEGICKELNPKFSYKKLLDPYINEMSFDLNYFEKKGNKDFNKFKEVPDKLELNNISIGILENDVINLKSKVVKEQSKNKILSFVIGFVLLSSEINIEFKMLLISLSYMLLYK